MNKRFTAFALAAVMALASTGAMAQTTTGATAPGQPNVNAAPSQTSGTTGTVKSHHVKKVKKTTGVVENGSPSTATPGSTGPSEGPSGGSPAQPNTPTH